MIQSIVGRRSHQHQHIIRVDAKLTQPSSKCWVGLKVGEVNVFLRAVITPHFAGARAVMPQLFRGKTRGNDYSRSKTKREVVCRLIFVVHQRDWLNSQRSRRENL